MRLLLDTHVLLWALADDPRLSPRFGVALSGDVTPVVSAVTIWEIAALRAQGRLVAPRNMLAVMEAAGCVPMALTWQHSERAGHLPPHHDDPFDRLLIAQSQIEGVPLISDNAALRAYDVDLY